MGGLRLASASTIAGRAAVNALDRDLPSKGYCTPPLTPRARPTLSQRHRSHTSAVEGGAPPNCTHSAQLDRKTVHNESWKNRPRAREVAHGPERPRQPGPGSHCRWTAAGHAMSTLDERVEVGHRELVCVRRSGEDEGGGK